MVCAEGTRVGTAWNRVQHRGFNLKELVRYHEFTDAADCLAACDEAFARILIGHQIDVTLAVFDFLVSHSMELVGHRAQTFCEQTHLRGVYREFTGSGFENSAHCCHDVTKIPVLETGVHVGTDFFAFDVDLNSTRTVLQCGKACLAHHSLEHHASGNPGNGSLLQQQFGCFVGVCCQQGAGLVSRFEIVGEGNTFAFELVLTQSLELFAPFCHELVFVLCSGCGIFFGHEW